MTSRVKPLLTVLGLLVALCAALFMSSQAASAYPPGVAPVISINPSDPSCGSPVTIHGSHYKPGSVVVITVNGHREAAFTVGKDGDFDGTFTLVCHGTGPQTIRASGGGGVDSLTISPSSSSSGGSGNGSTQHGAGSLSSTGTAVLGIGGVGLLLLAGGGLLLFAGRRRRTA